MLNRRTVYLWFQAEHDRTVLYERVSLLELSEMMGFIRNLSPYEASRVLNGLLDISPDLAGKVYGIALTVACDVDADDIMGDVFFELDTLTVDVLNGRAGSTRYGYVEPAQAAGEIFDETMDPFIGEMVRNRERGLHSIAKAYCFGIIKGLRMYIRESKSDFKEWISHDARVYVHVVVADWLEGRINGEDEDEVMGFVEDGWS